MSKGLLLMVVSLLLVINSILLVSADGLSISPNPYSLSVYKGLRKSFDINISNYQSFRVYNLSFSNITFFDLPLIPSLEAGESRVVSGSVLSDWLGSQSFVSTVSSLYDAGFNSSSQSYDLNISTVFSPSNLSVFVGDVVVWRNFLGVSVDVKDLSSGVTLLSIPSGGSFSVNYSVTQDLFFYCSSGGFTGSLHVLPRSSGVFVHNSVFDRVLVFNVDSLLNPSSLKLEVFPLNFTLNNNQSGTGILSVSNLENVPIVGINLSDSRGWVSFGDNFFNLSGLQNKLVSFNVTPVVTQTSQTNKSYHPDVFARSVNAGNSSVEFRVFLVYQNMDSVIINGTSYTITVLGVNDTINACMQHGSESGFEKCNDLRDWARVNVTIIKEVEAVHKLSEADVVAIGDSAKRVGDVSERTEQLNLRLFDTINNFTNVSYEYRAMIVNLSLQNAFWRSSYDEQQRFQSNRFWVVFTFLMVLLLVGLVVKLVRDYQLVDAFQRGGQL